MLKDREAWRAAVYEAKQNLATEQQQQHLKKNDWSTVGFPRSVVQQRDSVAAVVQSLSRVRLFVTP